MIVIEKMNNTHIASVAQLERENFSMPWSENVLTAELRNPLALWLVAVLDDEVVGYVGAQIVPDEADMMNVAVSSTHRRKGVARGLILELLDQLKEQGVRSLSLEVRASNSAAITLYDGLGFNQVGRRPGYYKMPKEDALILRKEWQL
jgi:ribosomal-protein-alanine N-acetyltransferase